MDFEMNKKPHVLFVVTKWCAGNPNYGISAYESNLLGSLESSGLATCKTFYHDEYWHIHQQTGDSALLQKCIDTKPDIVFILPFAPSKQSPFNMAPNTFEIIKSQLKIPIVAMWGDFQPLMEIGTSVQSFIDFNIVTGSSTVLSRISQPEKYMYFWCPKDPRYFYNPGMERDIPISFVGSVQRRDRPQAIKTLRMSGIDVYQTGGEREQHIPVEQYAQIFMRSKISLSFCRSSRMFVINARPFEATLCGAMLLEEEGFETAKMFVPFVDYVPYSSEKDLVDKAKYYLEHDYERQEIADSGCRKAHEQYSAKRFWQIVLNRTIKSISNEQGYEKNVDECKMRHFDVSMGKDIVPVDDWGTVPLGLPTARLSKLRRSHILKLMLLHFIYSHRLLFTILFTYRKARYVPFRRLLTFPFRKARNLFKRFFGTLRHSKALNKIK